MSWVCLIERFKQYPSDVRLKMYTNLGNNRREGLFIFGKISDTDDKGRDGLPQGSQRPLHA